MAEEVAASRGMTLSALGREAFLSGIANISSEGDLATPEALRSDAHTSRAASLFSSTPDAIAAYGGFAKSSR